MLPGRLRFGITRALQQAYDDVSMFRPVDDLLDGQRVNQLKLASCICSELRQFKYRFGFWSLFCRLTVAEGGEEVERVAHLVSRPFSRWTFQEKIDIVEKEPEAN